MKSHFYHLEINVTDATQSFPFYKDFLGYLAWRVILEEEKLAGFSDGQSQIWIGEVAPAFKKNTFHRKNTGLNHLAFRVEAKEDVDRFCREFLEPRKIGSLYQSPKLFPEYSPTYYAVYFEDPDRIKLEVVYL